MRKPRSACAVFVFVLMASAPNVHPQAATVQRDPQALAILAQIIQAGGGVDLLTSIQDLSETGTVTY